MVLRQMMTAVIVLIATGCTGLQYETGPSQLISPGYALSYPQYEIVISTEDDPAAPRGQINCYDDAGCIEQLFAFARSSPDSGDWLFMSSLDGSRLTVDYGPYGHGVRAVGWEADAPNSDSLGTASDPYRWRLRTLADPSAATLRLRIGVPMVLSLPVVAEEGHHVVGNVGTRNLGLSYSVSFGARATGVVSVTKFVERAQKAREQGKDFPWFPVAACRTATITLIAKATNGTQEEIAEVSLPVPDVSHVLPVPFRRGSYIRLDPICGINSHD